jgi:hypothetical protein
MNQGISVGFRGIGTFLKQDLNGVSQIAGPYIFKQRVLAIADLINPARIRGNGFVQVERTRRQRIGDMGGRSGRAATQDQKKEKGRAFLETGAHDGLSHGRQCLQHLP